MGAGWLDSLGLETWEEAMMGEQTEISWCDKTFNPLIGCTKVSPACANCYAEREQDHRHHRVKWGPQGTRSLTSDTYWKQPLKWNRESEIEGVCFCCGGFISRSSGCPYCDLPPIRPRVFCASLADVFEDWDGPIHDHHGQQMFWSHSRAPHQPAFHWISDQDAAGGEQPVTTGDVRLRLFALIDTTPHLDWLLLTKRPENIRRMWPAVEVSSQQQADDRNERGELYRRNVWLGTSVENQEYANKRIPELLKCRDVSPVLWLSCEPLLGAVNLHPWLCKHANPSQPAQKFSTWCDSSEAINWVIAGGESGPNARPSNPYWFHALRDQCEAAEVAFHFKQNGEFVHVDDAIAMGLTNTYDGKFHPYDQSLGVPMVRVGKKAAGRLLDGVLHDAFPEVQR